MRFRSSNPQTTAPSAMTLDAPIDDGIDENDPGNTICICQTTTDPAAVIKWNTFTGFARVPSDAAGPSGVANQNGLPAVADNLQREMLRGPTFAVSPTSVPQVGNVVVLAATKRTHGRYSGHVTLSDKQACAAPTAGGELDACKHICFAVGVVAEVWDDPLRAQELFGEKAAKARTTLVQLDPTSLCRIHVPYSQLRSEMGLPFVTPMSTRRKQSFHCPRALDAFRHYLDAFHRLMVSARQASRDAAVPMVPTVIHMVPPAEQARRLNVDAEASPGQPPLQHDARVKMATPATPCHQTRSGGGDGGVQSSENGGAGGGGGGTRCSGGTGDGGEESGGGLSGNGRTGGDVGASGHGGGARHGGGHVDAPRKRRHDAASIHKDGASAKPRLGIKLRLQPGGHNSQPRAASGVGTGAGTHITAETGRSDATTDTLDTGIDEGGPSGAAAEALMSLWMEGSIEKVMEGMKKSVQGILSDCEAQHTRQLAAREKQLEEQYTRQLAAREKQLEEQYTRQLAAREEQLKAQHEQEVQDAVAKAEKEWVAELQGIISKRAKK